jgi:hypothetical protein
MDASPDGKVDWIRKALLSAAGSDKPALFTEVPEPDYERNGDCQ